MRTRRRRLNRKSVPPAKSGRRLSKSLVIRKGPWTPAVTQNLEVGALTGPAQDPSADWAQQPLVPNTLDATRWRMFESGSPVNIISVTTDGSFIVVEHDLLTDLSSAELYYLGGDPRLNVAADALIPPGVWTGP